MLNSAKGNLSDYENVEALKHCIDKRWSTFTCNRALSNILGLPVLSVSLVSGDEFAALLSNSTTLNLYLSTDHKSCNTY